MKHAPLGQHFLTRPELAEAVADALPVSKHETVLEIGPGRGILTRVLLARAARVVALEKDPDLVRELGHTFVSELTSGALVLREQDVRDFIPEKEGCLADGYTLIANIPYYITGTILRQFLSAPRQPAHMVLLVQKEVAERVVAADGKESLLSLSVKAYGTPRYIRTIRRGSFTPAPKVDSAVLAIDNISRDNFASHAVESHFFALIRAGFGSKRKQVGKLVAPYVDDAAFDACAVQKDARAEDVGIASWLCLAKHAAATPMSRSTTQSP